MRMRKGTLLAQQLCTSQHVLNEVPPSPRAIHTVHVRTHEFNSIIQQNADSAVGLLSYRLAALCQSNKFVSSMSKCNPIT